MNKKSLIITLAVLAVIIAGGVFLLASDNSRQAAEQDTAQSQTAKPASNDTAPATPTASTGSYIDYKEGIIAATPGTKLLFFHAPWCPQCRALETDIKQRGVPEGVSIIKVDYDSNQALRQKYGVTLQTTVVKVGDNGELVEKFVAYEEPTLASVTKSLLP